MSILDELSIAFSSDPRKTYDYWDKNKQQIRYHTYLSAFVGALAGLGTGLFIDSRGYWLFAGSLFVVLMYHFGSATFIVASHLPDSNANQGEMNRYEYLSYNLQEISIRYRSSAQFFITPKIFYIVILLTTAYYYWLR